MTANGMDKEWFEQAIIAALPDLYGTALRLVRNQTDAEDLVAETVLRAWTNREALSDPAKLRGWLFRILTNAFISGRRSAARRGPHQSLDEGNVEAFSLFDRLHAPFLLWWGNPEREFLDRLLREDLASALDSLPEPFRLTVVLADVQGWSYQEIADALEIPIGTVRSRLARGRAQLQKSLWHHAQDAGLVPADPREETKHT